MWNLFNKLSNQLLVYYFKLDIIKSLLVKEININQLQQNCNIVLLVVDDNIDYKKQVIDSVLIWGVSESYLLIIKLLLISGADVNYV